MDKSTSCFVRRSKRDEEEAHDTTRGGMRGGHAVKPREIRRGGWGAGGERDGHARRGGLYRQMRAAVRGG